MFNDLKNSEFWSSPKTLGMLNFAAGMMSPTRGGTFGEALGQGINQGLGVYIPLKQEARQAEEDKKRRQLMDSKMQSMERAKQMQDAILSQVSPQTAPAQFSGPQEDLSPVRQFGGVNLENPTIQDVQRAQVMGDVAGMPGYGKTVLAQWQRNNPAADPRPWWAGSDGSVDPAMLAKTNAGKPETKVTVSNNANLAGNKKWEETRATSIDARIKDYSTRADQSVQTGYNLQRISESLNSIDTGPWEETKYGIANTMASLGFPINEKALTDKTLFKSVVSEQVRKMLNEAKGPQTDADRAFLETIVPGLGKTKESNQKLISYAESSNLINRYYGQQARKVWGQNDSSSANSMISDIQNNYENTPAGMIINGKSVTFAEFVRTAQARGKTNMDEIIQGWISLK